VCHEYIGTTLLRITRAKCALCERIEAGEDLTEAAIEQYMASKGNRVDVTMLLLKPEPQLTKKKFSLSHMVGDFLEAVGLKKTDAVVQPSVAIAKEKRRKRLFDNIDIGGESEKPKGKR
jgi:hypothetical protein